MTTDLAVIEHDGNVNLFAGATPADVINAATEAANALADVVKSRRLSLRISTREHVLIEGWQTLGTLVGVFAVEGDGVVAVDWPELAPTPDEPVPAGEEPRRKGSEAWNAWKVADDQRAAWVQSIRLRTARDNGLTFGFRAAFAAVKDGRPVGWGEGRCVRTESNWTSRDDYALASMAQTRGQSRALAAPLRFIVKLAGYETTPAEEMPPAGYGESVVPAAVYLTGEDEAALIRELQERWSGVDAHGFVRVLKRGLNADSVPEVAARALRGWIWWTSTEQASGNARADTVDGDAVDVPADDTSA